MKKCKWMFVLACLLFAGCTEEKEVIQNELENLDSVVMSDEIYGDNQNSVTDIIDVRGEEFKLKVTYDTGDMLLNEWRVTSNKSVSMEVSTEGLPEGYEVHVEHVHADVSLKAEEPRLDGITHDSMDDSDHRSPTKGFTISDDITYHNIFAIAGYCNEFYEIWGHTFGQYGYTNSSYEKLTEKNIRKNGVYAEKLSVVYDIVITRPDGSEYVRSVYSEVLIPLVGEIETVKVNIFTGEEKE